MEKQILAYSDNPQQWGRELERRRKKTFDKKKSLNKQTREKHENKYHNKPNPKKQ